MCVESSRCFYPNFGQSHVFFRRIYCGQQSIKRDHKCRKLTAKEAYRKIVTEPYGDHVKFIVTQPKSFDVSKLYYIDLASFRPWQLTRSYPVGKKISRCYNRGITHSRVIFNSFENLVPAQISGQSRTESHKKQSNTTQQNGTELETN